MSRTILHNQSYLYPCQLSTSFYQKFRQANLQQRQCQFVFYSPMDSFLSIYQLRKAENQLIDLDGKKFGLMQSIKIGRQQLFQATILSNTQEIIMVIKECQQYSNNHIITHTLQPNQQIVSNAIINVYDNNNSANSSLNDKKFNLIYLNKNQQNDQLEMIVACYEGNHQHGQKNQILIQERTINSETYWSESDKNKLFVNPEESENNTNLINNKKNFNHNHQVRRQASHQPQLTSQYNHKQTCTIPFPQLLLPQNHTILSQPLHLYQSSFHNPSSIIIFDKHSETVNFFDVNYEVLTSSISCCSNYSERRERFSNMLLMEGRKVAVLSENLFIEYDSMGLFKIVDQRAGRIVQIRDLNEQFPTQTNLNNPNHNHPSYQQHFVKFWNTKYQQTQPENTQQQTNFLINMNNKIVNVDLRYNNNGALDNGFFQIQKTKMIGNYDIVKSEQSTLTAYTTENQHSFKSYVVEEIC